MSDHKRGIGAGLFGKESGTSYEVYLNLTPLMDVMSNLLFFLLASFGATMVAIMPTTVPTVSSGESPPKDDKPPEDVVNVTLRADAAGLTLKCESDTIAPDVIKDLGGKLPKKDGQYDYKQLTATLKSIKEKYPASKSVVVVPDDGVPYEIIVKILDAARDTRLVDTRNAILFPDVVLSGIATHDADGNLLK